MTDSLDPRLVTGWTACQGDPELLLGLTFGVFDDFAGALIELVIQEPLRRDVPLGLILRAKKAAETIETLVEWTVELTRIPVVTKFLRENIS